MNLIYITSSTNRSGGSRQALYTARGLVRRGHRLVFFAPRGAELPDLAPELDWRELPPARTRWGRAIRTALPQKRPFVLHAFHNKAVKLAAWWGLFLRRQGGVFLAQRGVVYPPNNPLPYWSPGIDCFVANSKACAAVLRRKGVGAGRLRVVYNGIPPERITPRRGPESVLRELGLPQDDPRPFLFGCVANDSANKGAPLLLQALARLPEGRLLLLGVTPDRIRPLLAELGLEERVSVPGKREDIAEYLQLCRAFVLPSRSESMPNTLQEAICMGLPVVATAVGGVPECVKGNGLLVPPDDVVALAEAMATLRAGLEHGAESSGWSAAGRELAGLFSLERKLDRMEALYRELLQRRGLAGSDA